MLNFQEFIDSLLPEYPENLVESNRKKFLESGFSIIVLDDDPTGTQTISDVPVLTSWSVPEIITELGQGTLLFFILTNSRSLNADDADRLAVEIGDNIRKALLKTQRKVIVISRGDSTLRGHYPNEVDALGNGLGIPGSPHILIPALFEGGRHTANDIHYVREGDYLIPAGETPFALDTSFGYRSSDLKEYIGEKSGGKIRKEEVISISLEDLRIGGPAKVAEILNRLGKFKACVVNAFSPSDLDVFAAGFYMWTVKPVNFLLRTAASVIPALSGLETKEPLRKIHFDRSGRGGIIAVGSYVPKTNLQLDYLKKKYPAEYVEITAADFLDINNFGIQVKTVAQKINRNLDSGQTVVVYTSREVITGKNKTENLSIVNKVSAGIVEIMKMIVVRPRFIIAKGGITSSDILTKSLGIKRAEVLGQIIPGVPVWQLNDCQKFPGLIYIPFPGNLGGDDALFQAIRKLI